MTFKLNQISTSADGREIKRAKEVAGDRLTIGRSPASDVHLTDLAVAISHATLQRTSSMRLTVSAEEGLGVELNGRKVTSGVIDLAQGGELRIASHLLRVLPAPEDARQIDIDVERVGESANEELSRVDTNRFSLGAVMPGKRISAYVLIVLVLGVFLAWPIWIYSQRAPADHAQIVAAQRNGEPPRQAGFQPDSLWSSGSLSQVHHNLENQCGACHVKAFEPVQDTACQSCHTNVHNHGDQSRSKEEAFARYLRSQPRLDGWARFQLAVAERFGRNAGRCVDCHTEHEGPQEMPRTAQHFCSDCHSDLQARLPDTDLGNASSFGSQRDGPQRHPEFQPLVLIDWSNDERPRLARVGLDRNPSENSNLKFPHALHLDPSGGATQMARRLRERYEGREQLGCADCHTPTPDGARYQPVDMEEDCSACHTLGFDVSNGVTRTLRHGSPDQVVADLREYYSGRVPARPAELAPVARRRPGDINQVRTAVQYARARAGAGSAAGQAIRAVFQPGGACYACHAIEQRGPLDFHVRPVAFPSRYLLNGWFDHRAHVTMDLPGQGNSSGDGACLTCHAANRSNQAANLLIPGLESCQRCHGDENDQRSAVPSGCAMCHDYHMDKGAPAMILRQRVRGRRWETTVMPVATLPRAR